jgi:hypothetical protein
VGDRFIISSMKSRNGIFWMVHWWVLCHSSLWKPVLSSNYPWNWNQKNKLIRTSLTSRNSLSGVHLQIRQLLPLHTLIDKLECSLLLQLNSWKGHKSLWFVVCTQLFWLRIKSAYSTTSLSNYTPMQLKKKLHRIWDTYWR